MASRDLRPLWTTWRCRRNANLFMFSLAGFFVSLAILGIIVSTGLHQHLLPVLPVVAVFFAIWTVKTWRRMRALRSARPERGPLSRDELRKARSKLVKDRKGV